MTDEALKELLSVASEAGDILMEWFRSTALRSSSKEDGSPVTEADLAASRLLERRLPLLNGAPVLSEEAVVPFEARRSWDRLWIVDPLDGTQDFLAQLPEFCVCIALVEAGVPVAGVLHAPALGETFYARKGKGAYVVREGASERLPRLRNEGWVVARSRFHDSGEIEEFLAKNKITEARAVGSALKFARVAEGAATLFPRLKPSSEWDVAAGHILVEEAGGTVEALTGAPLRYNGPSTKVPGFLALGPGLTSASLWKPGA